MASCFTGLSLFAADPIKEEMKRAVLLDPTYTVQIEDSVMGDMFVIGKKLSTRSFVTFGNVYSAVRIADSKLVALKYVKKGKIFNYFDELRTMPMELHVHKLLKDVPGVIHLLDVFITSQSYVLVTEQPSMTVKNLHDYIRSKYVYMYEDQARYIMKQILTIMRDIHNAGVFHQDIKPANILIEPKTSQIYVIDFEAARLVSQEPYNNYFGAFIHSYISTPREVLLIETYDAEPATVWTIGITLYKMVTRTFPHKSYSDIVENRLDFSPYSTTIDLRDFIRKCLTNEPSERPTLSQLLRHPWMTPRPNQPNGEYRN